LRTITSKFKVLANFCLFYLLLIYKNILTFLLTVKSRNQANRYSQCPHVLLLFNALFTLERGFITNVYGLFSARGHHFYKCNVFKTCIRFVLSCKRCYALHVLFIRFLKETVSYCLALQSSARQYQQM
jgi:hypothetical protein